MILTFVLQRWKFLEEVEGFFYKQKVQNFEAFLNLDEGSKVVFVLHPVLCGTSRTNLYFISLNQTNMKLMHLGKYPQPTAFPPCNEREG